MENSKVKSTAYLTQIYGENTNRKFKLMCTKVTIGRSFHAEIRLQNPNISRSHCTLFYDKGWSISDNKSQNGTYVSGRKLKPGETRPLQCGDIIFLGPPSEMPEAFCYDDAFIDDEDMPEIGHEIIELPPAKRPAAEEMIASKRKSLESESSDNEFDKLLASSLSNRLIHKIEFASQSTEPYDSSKQIDNQLLQKNLSPLKIKSVKDFKSLSQQDQAVTMTQTAYSVSVHSPPSKQSKLYNSDSGYQINEISSTGDDQAEDSLSLLDIEKNEIVEPSCSTSCTKSPSSVQDSETSREVDILKSKLALMAEQIKKIEESKLDLLKNYEVVCEKNFALDQQLVEKKKIEEDLKNCELKMQDKIKNELLEKFEEDLICNICTELLIKPTVLDCSHTYCLFCIKEWRKKKNECPICRRKITTMTPVLTLEHFIDKALSTLTPEQKEKRNQLIIERENQPKKVATPTSRRYRGRRRYRRSYTSINQDIRQMINQSRENDVQIVGERRAVLPMPIPPIAMSSVYLRIPRMPDMLLNSNPGDDHPISVYLG